MNSIDRLLCKQFSFHTLEEKLAIKKLGRPTPHINLTQLAKTRTRQFTRKFNLDTYTRYKWLCGCDVRHALFCFPCVLFGGEYSWTRSGMVDLNHLSERIKKHETSALHVKNNLRLVILDRPRVGSKLGSAALTDAQQPSSSGKEAGLISYTNPGPSTSQENLLVEPEDLIFVKEEPYVSDNEQEHYETAFVDFSATESYRHDELSESSYGGAPIPETYYGVETESNVEPSDAQQSGHVIEKAVSLAAGQAHDSKRRSTQDSTKQDNARSCDEKEHDKTSSPTETNGNNTKSRIRVMELTLEQLKKEHKAKMKEHEANMREHETRMSNHEKITEKQLDIMKKEHDMKIAEIEFRYQDLKKKSDWDNKVHKLTLMNLQQKLSTCQLEHQEKSKLHELVVQELQQKLTNSQLEHRILLKKLKELGE